jgi:hypothetical protein
MRQVITDGKLDRGDDSDKLTDFLYRAFEGPDSKPTRQALAMWISFFVSLR